MSKRQDRLRRQRKADPHALPYDEWHPGTIPGADSESMKLQKKGTRAIPDAVFMNSRYEVWVYRNIGCGDAWPRMHWLSIKRRDKEAIHDWRDLQRIKNDLIGPENEGVELYPAESRLADSANQYHLWVLADPSVQFPFGYQERLVAEGSWQKSKQRPFEDRPADCLNDDDIEKMVRG